MLLFYDCQTDRGILTVANVAPDTQDFADKINEACRRLMDYGDWWATLQKIRIACYTNHITWPRWVADVRALRCDGIPVKLLNGWNEFLPLSADDWREIGRCYPHREHLHSEASINESGTSPVFRNVPYGMANYILAFPRNPIDEGKTMTIWGMDSNGMSNSETLTMPSQGIATYIATKRTYQRIDRVVKDASIDYFDVYQCADATPTTLLEMAHYEPSETRPEYRVTGVTAHHHGTHVDGSPRTYSALVKLQHIDARSGNDPVLPGNRAAIKIMLLSMAKEEAADPVGAENESTRAVHELNRELNNRLPEFQIPVSYEEFGGVDMRRHGAF